MKYFAYGSNMSLARLSARTPSARRLGPARLPKHSLRFHKPGADGSAKCDAFYTGLTNDEVWGTLWHLDPAEKPALDAVEGLGFGYEIKQVRVYSEASEISAYTYYATEFDANLKPYSWYLRHVLVGARESELPHSYQHALSNIAYLEDDDSTRHHLEMRIHD